MPSRYGVRDQRVPANDCYVAPALIERLPAAGVIVVDTSRGGERIHERFEAGAPASSFPRVEFALGNADVDRGLYRYRHLVETVLARRKR